METGVTAPGRATRVLLVDTDRETAGALAEALERDRDGVEVLLESEPDSALERFEAGHVDCVVSEYDLPGGDGVGLLEAVRERDGDVPFVLFTGSGDEAVASRAVSAGVTEYVRKSGGGVEAVAERVRSLLGGDVPVAGESGYDRTQFRQFLRAFPDPTFVVDEDGRYVDFITGDERSLPSGDVEEILGQRFHDVLSADTADRFLRTVRRALETGEQQRIEYQLDVGKGSRWFEARVGPLEPDADPRTAFWIARDITERRRREREYEQIFDGVNDAIAVFDPETAEIVDANEAYHDMVGYDDLETIRELGIQGLSASDEGFTGDRGARLVRRVAERGDPETVDWRAETGDGERLWLEVTLAPAAIGGEDRVLSIQRDVTERRELEQTYRDLFESVSDGLVVHDPVTGEILEVNERYCELTGYDRAELLEESIQLIMPDDPEYTYEEVLDRIKLAREEGPQLFEFKGERKDGTVFVGDVHLRTVEIRGRERVLASVRDITERKRREREYEQIFDGVNDVITVHDPETAELLEVNDTFCELLGYDRESILEMGIAGYSPTDGGYTLEEAREFVHRVVEAEETRQTEWAVETSDGETRWLDVKGTTVELGGETKYVSISRDVTERRRREREYEQIFHGVNDIIAVRDPESGELIDANRSYADLLGYEREEMRGMTIEDVGVPEDGYDDERGMEHVRNVMESEGSVEFEWAVEDADGRVHTMDVRATDALVNGERRYLAIGRDVTGRKRRERAIDTLQEATERFQTARTPEEVATIAVEAASEMLDLPMAVCWFEADGRLEPAAATGPTREAGLVSELSGDRYEYAVFEAGTATEYRPSEAGSDNPLETGVLLPLADHGLIAAGARRDTEVDETVLDVAKALSDHVATALKRVERAQAVRESERRFRLIAERIDEVIYFARPDFSEVLYVNPAYEEIWGRPVESLETEPRSFLDAADYRDRDALEDDFDRMVDDIEAGEADDSYEFEYRIRQPDGEIRWVSATGYAVELPGGKRRFVGVVEDVTERKRREQRLEVFNRILRHNLRNQLDVIRSHAETLSDRTEGDHAERIMASVDELATIGSEARETDRIMSMDEETAVVDVSETIRDVLARVEPDDGGPDVTTALDATTVKTHEEAVSIAVESAVENAIEHADSAVTVTASDRGTETVVAVADDGPGIPAEQLAPIETGTETSLRHGRGLGLWQLRWSVDTLNGELSFETDDGTTVRIEIPDRRGAAERT